MQRPRPSRTATRCWSANERSSSTRGPVLGLAGWRGSSARRRSSGVWPRRRGRHLGQELRNTAECPPRSMGLAVDATSGPRCAISTARGDPAQWAKSIARDREVATRLIGVCQGTSQNGQLRARSLRTGVRLRAAPDGARDAGACCGEEEELRLATVPGRGQLRRRPARLRHGRAEGLPQAGTS